MRAVGSIALLAVLVLAPVAARSATPSPVIAFATDRAENLHRANLYSIGLDGRGRRLLARDVRGVRSPDGRLRAFSESVAPFTQALFLDPLVGDGPTRRLTPDTLEVAFEFGVAFSPGGGQIAFVGYDPCSTMHCARLEVWVVGVDGSGLHRVASGHSPSWSPEGSRLAFAGDLDFNNEAAAVFAARADGTGVRRLARGIAPPVWAPRGERIAYVGTADCRGVCVVNSDGSARHSLAGGRAAGLLWSPDARRLAFAREDGTLWTVAARGRPARRLAAGAGSKQPAAWSPDGSRLALVHSRVDNVQLAVVAVAGGLLRPVTREPPNTRFDEIRFAPNGRKLVFAATLDRNDTEIAIVAPAGGAVRALTRNTLDDRQPAWSPDGTRLVFSRASRNAATLWTMRADGSGQRRITPWRPHTRDASPAWSPDGRRLAFVRGRRGTGRLFVASADGSNARLVTHVLAAGSRLSWSPDGTRIAFAALPTRTSWPQIYTVRPDGSRLTRVTHRTFAAAAAWSPDGSRILFTTEPDEARFGTAQDLYVIRPDGSDLARVAEDVAGNDGGSWSPDGARIAFSRGFDASQLVVANADGSGARTITSDLAVNVDAAWRP